MLNDIGCLPNRNRHAWVGPDKADPDAKARVLCAFCCKLVYLDRGIPRAICPPQWVSEDTA